MIRAWVGCVFFLLGSIAAAANPPVLIVNPTRHSCKDELVSFAAPAGKEPLIAKMDGAETPYQVELIDQKRRIWVCADFEPGQTHRFETAEGKPAAFAPRVTLRKAEDGYLLDNGTIAIKVPAERGEKEIPGPVSAIKLGEKWVGGSRWNVSVPLREFTATVVGDGALFGKVRLRYDFEGAAGVDGKEPAFAEVYIKLSPGMNHAEIFERHETARGDCWEFEASRGWSPMSGISRPFGQGAGSGEVAGKVMPDRALTPGGLPLGSAISAASFCQAAGLPPDDRFRQRIAGLLCDPGSVLGV